MLCELRNVTKTYGGERAVTPVKNLDLSINEGDFISVSGISGAGKSTLLFLISGMLQPSSGAIFFEGHSYRQMDDARLSNLRAANIGYVSQNIQLVQALTVEENIRLAQKTAERACGSKKDAPDTDYIMEYLGLTGKKDELLAHLSGGQKRRAVIAVTWARNPRLILLDEPTNDLDGFWSRKVMDQLAVWHDEGKALLLVTHDHEYASSADIRLELVNGVLSSAE